jgi:hypothetical protein
MEKKKTRDREISAIDRIFPILNGLNRTYYTQGSQSGGRRSVRAVLAYFDARFPEGR